MSNDNKIQLGLKDTKEVLSFAFNFVKGIDGSLQGDGKFTVGDLPNFLPSLLDVKAAFEDIDMVPVEFMNITEEESIELRTWVGTEFNISSEKVEEAIEDAIAIILDIWVLYVRYFSKPVQENTPTSPEPVA